MTEKEVQKAIKDKKAEFVTQPEQPNQSKQSIPPIDEMAKYITFLEMLRRPKRHLTSAPTFTPKTFLEQIQFYDDEAGSPTRRIYFYVNGGWHYVTLT